MLVLVSYTLGLNCTFFFWVNAGAAIDSDQLNFSHTQLSRKWKYAHTPIRLVCHYNVQNVFVFVLLSLLAFQEFITIELTIFFLRFDFVLCTSISLRLQHFANECDNWGEIHWIQLGNHIFPNRWFYCRPQHELIPNGIAFLSGRERKSLMIRINFLILG